MTGNGNGSQPVLVVVQLSGGNDFMNTVIPYTNSTYYDSRPTVAIPHEKVLPFTDTLAFHPNMGPFKELYDQGMVAIVQGIGYPDSNRSHFRGMDIWHTCEPHVVATVGWVAKALNTLDPEGSNPLTGINFGVGLPRAMAMPGVPVTSVSNLDNYGLMTGIGAAEQRDRALDIFKRMYAPAIGSGPVMEYLSQTGNDVLAGADMIAVAPQQYESTIEYAATPIAQALRDVARVHTAGLARGSSTPPTADTTSTPTRTRPNRRCWETFRRRYPTSSPTCESTTPTTTSRCSCSPSSAGGFGTTVPAPTTDPAAGRSF